MNVENNSLETNLAASFRESVSLAFLNLLKNTIELFSNPLTSSMDTLNPQLDEMIDYGNDMFLSLREILNEDNHPKYKRTQDFLNYKNEIAKLFRMTYGYVIEINIITFLIEEQYQLTLLHKADIGILDYNQFYEECRVFIFGNQGQEERNHRLNKVLKHIPIRITKNRFFDYIKKSIQQIRFDTSPESLNEFFDTLKLQFTGKSVKDYGVFFSDIASFIDNFEAKNLAALTEQDIEKLWNEIEKIGDTLSDIIKILSALFKIYNTLSVLMMLENVTLQTLYDRHIAYKDFYQSTSSILNWATNPEEKELLQETLPDLLDQHIRILENNLQKNHSKIIQQIEEKDTNHSIDHELSKEIQNYQLMIHYINSDLSDLFSYEKKTAMTEDFNEVLGSYLQAFEDFMNKEFHDMPNLYRKARMQHFLGCIPAIMTENEFMDYLQTSIEACSTEERKALVLSKIGTIMDSYGFFENQLCDCEHEHIHEHHHGDYH